MLIIHQAIWGYQIMEITIHQAILGDKNRGYFLLNTTLEGNFAEELGYKTDLIDRPQDGEQWQPALRGFEYKEYYVLFKSYKDNSEGVRNGRIFTHALLIQKKDLPYINNLSVLIQYFSSTLNKEITISPIEYKDIGYQPNINLLPRISCVFKGLFENKTNFVWVGQENFEEMVCTIWSQLSPEKRVKLFIGITFNPKYHDNAKFRLLASPESLTNKWKRYNPVLIQSNDKYEAQTLAEHFVFGNQEEAKPLIKFIEGFNLNADDYDKLNTWQKIAPTLYNLESITDFPKVYALITTIPSISPDSTKHINIKDKILNHFITLLNNVNQQQIIAAIKINTTPFLQGNENLKAAFTQWCEKWIFVENPNNYLNSILSKAITNTETWWSSQFITWFETKLDKWQSYYAQTLWSALDKTTINIIADKIPYSSQNDFITTILPNIEREYLDIFLDFSALKDWYLLHAHLLKSNFAIQEAINKQLAIDKNNDYLDALQLLSDSVDNQVYIKNILSFSNKRLFQIAANYCDAKPSLLSQINIGEKGWQKIWLLYLQKGNFITRGIDNPQEVIFMLLDEILAYKQIEEELLYKIADTDFGNLWEYPKRKDIWNKLNYNVRDKFLEKTAKAYLNKLEKYEDLISPESELLTKIKSEASSYMRKNNRNITFILHLFKNISLSEKSLVDYIYYYDKEINIAEAQTLGKYISTRNWSDAAGSVYEKAKRIESFKHTLKECYSLLSFWNKGDIFLSNLFSIDFTPKSISQEDWWIAFKETAIEIYPEGPKQDGIWEDAGGDKSDLINGGGKEAWREAIEKLKKGIEKPTAKKLLKEMKKTYPNNPQLNILYSLYEKRW